MTDLLAPVLACGSFQYGKGHTCCILLERLEQRDLQLLGGYRRRRCIWVPAGWRLLVILCLEADAGGAV